MKSQVMIFLIAVLFTVPCANAQVQDEDVAEMINQILLDKFDIILPQIMREHEIDMWIHIVREGDLDPLGYNFGSNEGVFIFTDRGGDRIERAFFGFNSDKVEESGAYDVIVKPEIKTPLEAYPNIRIYSRDFFNMEGAAEWPGTAKTELDFRFPGVGEFVAERDPKRIAVNYLEELGSAIFYEFPRLRPDGISYTDYNLLVKALGNIYAGRIMSSEYLVVDYFARPFLSEFDLYTRIRSDINEKHEKALSSIVRGVTTLSDLGRISARDKNGQRQRSDYVIQGGELLTLTDGAQSGGFQRAGWQYGNYHEVIDAYAYVLEKGKSEPPAHIKRLWNDVKTVRKILEDNIKVGRTGDATYEILKLKVAEAGMINTEIQRFEREHHADKTWVAIDLHAAGSGIYAPRIGPLGPDWQNAIKLPLYHHFYMEFFIDIPMPEWGEGESINLRFHDGVMTTERGVEYFFPYPKELPLIR